MRLRGRCCKAGSTYANINRENFELALRNLKASPRWPSKSPTLSLCLYIIDRVSYIAECSKIPLAMQSSLAPNRKNQCLFSSVNAKRL
ncbi:Uncharacterized protein APZ42_002281 [Daphnia magna]|uniref:Uncharacterized protein n=1 Tax=Daphnia magna TaxID=35525 RepID=A0A164IDK4_9CRUS|nr:Uncharacterized protein APZ42_002281 [Daphnia magna]